MDRSGADPTAGRFADQILGYVGFVVGAILALEQVGIDTGSLLASFGIVGFTVGFAAQDALSNVISGLFIFWDRPFVVGDLVEIEGSYGRVAEITVRTTRVVTPDGKMLAIPNKTVVNGTVVSYTNFPHLRLDVPIAVGVGEDLGRVRNILLEVVEVNPAFLRQPPPQVVVTALNDYNLGLSLQAWIRDEQAHVGDAAWLREAAFEALRAAGVEMPFETLALAPIELHAEEEPPGIPVP
jgi:small conductance mechanosensitive channel